jgi:predicted phage terminase large subunit-like protein
MVLPTGPLTPEQARLTLERALRLNRYMPHRPTAKQMAFMLLPHREAFYGGSGGGGKSDCLLMSALQDVHVPGYSALLLRRTYPDLALPGAIMDRMAQWLEDTDAQWIGKSHSWLFPSSARITFGYLQDENDKFRYRSAEFQFIGYDELTQFTQSQYQFLFSRLRRLAGSTVPLRMRSASNPGDVGHDWVRQHFLIEGPTHGRPYIPARIADNPFLDIEGYRQSLSHLDPITRAQIEDGDWDVSAAGNMFRRHWFKVVTDYPRQARLVRFWDLAATEPIPGVSPDPDWTCGVLMAEHKGQYWIIDVVHDRLSPKGVEDLVLATALRDTARVDIWIEQEPGSSGKLVVDDYQRRVLKGYPVHALKSSGSKIDRARPLSSAAEAGNVMFLPGTWHTVFLDEATRFPYGSHDDQVDAASGALSVTKAPRGRVVMI